MDYKNQYHHPQWQKKRLEILDRDNFTCIKCGDSENELHVHHKYYIPGRKVWDYDNDTFITLCHDCHKAEHNPPQEKPLPMADGLKRFAIMKDCFSGKLTYAQAKIEMEKLGYNEEGITK